MEAARETARDQFCLLIIFFCIFLASFSSLIHFSIHHRQTHFYRSQQSNSLGRPVLFFQFYNLIFSRATIPFERLSHVQNVVIAEKFNTARFWRIRVCRVERDLFVQHVIQQNHETVKHMKKKKSCNKFYLIINLIRYLVKYSYKITTWNDCKWPYFK